jgi:archaellum biogenesis ATPase FlaH
LFFFHEFVFIIVKKDKRWEGGNMIIHDDSVSAIISHATEERLKNIIEQIKLIVQQRKNLSFQVEILFKS